MSRFLIINESCSDNIGDHAINYGLQKLISNNDESFLSVGFDAKEKNEKGKEIVSKHGVKFLLKKIKKYISKKNQWAKYLLWIFKNLNRVRVAAKKEKYKGAFIGGGQLIQSGGTFPIAMFLWTYFLSKNNINIILIGVGCAEKFSKLDCYLYKKAFQRIHKIYARDNHSIQNIRNFFEVESEFIPDLAYALYQNYDKTVSNITIVGVTAYYVYLKSADELRNIKYLSVDEYVADWLDKVIYEIERGKHICFASTTVQDCVLSNHVYEILCKKGYQKSISIIRGVPDLNEYINILRNANEIISGRMHSLILGHLSKCEIQSTGVNTKVQHYMSEYSSRNVSEICHSLNNIFFNIIKKHN